MSYIKICGWCSVYCFWSAHIDVNECWQHWISMILPSCVLLILSKKMYSYLDVQIDVDNDVCKTTVYRKPTNMGTINVKYSKVILDFLFWMLKYRTSRSSRNWTEFKKPLKNQFNDTEKKTLMAQVKLHIAIRLVHLQYSMTTLIYTHKEINIYSQVLGSV